MYIQYNIEIQHNFLNFLSELSHAIYQSAHFAQFAGSVNTKI